MNRVFRRYVYVIGLNVLPAEVSLSLARLEHLQQQQQQPLFISRTTELEPVSRKYR